MDSPQSLDVRHDGDHHLRLVGVHDDGEHLVLSDTSGEEYVLKITEALRGATQRPIGRPSAAAADDAADQLSPREIQARIRAGDTAELLAEETNMDLDRLRTYEGPVLAERSWIASQAQNIEVSSPQPTNDHYRAVFGDEPALLGTMVRHRLSALGLDPSTAQWDARRNENRVWIVSVNFSLEGLRAEVGEQPPAEWVFRPSSKHVDNQNRWAQVLSEFGADDGRSNRRLSAVSDQPFNLEDGGPVPSSPQAGHGPTQTPEDPSQEHLLDVLQARRGQRLGFDEAGDDELAMMLTRDEDSPGSRGRLGPQLVTPTQDVPDHEGVVAGQPEDPDQASDDEPTITDITRTPATSDDQLPRDSEETTTENSDESSPEDDAETTTEDEEAATESFLRSRRKDQQPAKNRRPSVPSWDEIMFGAKHDS